MSVPPQLPLLAKLLQQQQQQQQQQLTVKLCSNYNSVGVTEKTVWYKRFSVITNVLLVCSRVQKNTLIVLNFHTKM